MRVPITRAGPAFSFRGPAKQSTLPVSNKKGQEEGKIRRRASLNAQRRNATNSLRRFCYTDGVGFEPTVRF
jgi:hypothetical protein